MSNDKINRATDQRMGSLSKAALSRDFRRKERGSQLS